MEAAMAACDSHETCASEGFGTDILTMSAGSLRVLELQIPVRRSTPSPPRHAGRAGCIVDDDLRRVRMRWLMLRGLIREQRHWMGFPTAMAEGMGTPGHPADVRTIDLPGFGTQNDGPVPATIEGFVDDVRTRYQASLTQEERSTPTSLLAISLGGMVALRWLHMYPDDFRCGVVINTSAGDLSPPWERFALRHWPKVALAPFMKPRGRETMLLHMTRNLPRAELASAIDEYTRLATQTPPRPRNAFAQLRAATKSTTPKILRTPLLVMAARNDRLVSVRCSEKIAKRLHAPLVLHDWAGHDLPLDDPTWTINQVKAFLQQAQVA
jgi:pimeloyl-ACP methyl ester carboxylesterase